MARNYQLNDIASYKDIKYSSESEGEDLFLRCEARKSRRKNLSPQKAVQPEISQLDMVKNPGSPLELLPAIETLQNHIFNGKNNLAFRDVALSSDDRLSGAEFLPDIYSKEVITEFQKNSVNGGLLDQFSEEDIFQESGDIETFEDSEFDTTKEEYHSYRAVKCNMCEQVFSFRGDFDKHYLECYGLPPVYTCTFCNKTAEKYSTFRSHCYRHVTEGRFKCDKCPKGFNLKSLLHIHVLTKHMKAKPFPCDQCGKNFVTKPGLTIHQKKHKTESKEDYPCVVCGKVLHTRGGLTSHMNVHRLGRRFMCDVCGKTFTQKVNMIQHVKQHTGDKPHVCDKCGKTFAERSHLSRHNSFHTDHRPYKCDICQKMYKTERCLKVHSLVHASERPFVCTFCDKGFLSSTKLKQHSNIHTGERPYKCKNCDRTFTNYPNLLKHTKRKHKLENNSDWTSEGENQISNSFSPTENSSNNLSSNQSSSGEMPLTRNDEVGLDQNLVNLSVTDEKFMFSQSFDLLTGPSNSVDVIVPYLQNTLPSHQSLIQHINQASLANQFTDMLHTQYSQQSVAFE